MLTCFRTGVKCSILYYSRLYKKIEAKSRQRILGDSISSGYKIDKSNGNVSIKLVNYSSNISSSTNEIVDIYVSIKTLGGNSIYPNFTVPVKFENLKKDLSNWGDL